MPDDKRSDKDILGKHLEKYYDGWGYAFEKKTRDVFFYNVPKRNIDMVKKKVKGIKWIKLGITKEKS